MGRNTGRGKVAYSQISPDPAKTGPTLGVVVVVVVVVVLCHPLIGKNDDKNKHYIKTIVLMVAIKGCKT